MDYEIEIGGKWVSLPSLEKNLKGKCVWEAINGKRVRRKLLTCNRYINTCVNFQPIHAEPTDDMIELILNAVSEYGLEKFMGDLHLSRVRFYSWKGKFTWISINAVEKACDILNLDVLDVLEGRRVRSGGSNESITFTTKLNSNRAILLAWLCMEGHLAILSPQIDIPQDDFMVLKDVQELFKKEYGVGGGIYKIKGKNAWRLLIASAPLRYILCKYFGIPLGHKCSKIRIPKQIFSGSNEIKKAFISGCIETDGTIYSHKRPKGRKSTAVFNLELISEEFINDFARLLGSLGYKFSIFGNSRPDYENYRTWNLQIGSVESFMKLYSDTKCYMINQKTMQRMKSLISAS